MRLELHLILWVTAGLAVVAALFHGDSTQLRISSRVPESAELYVLHDSEQRSPSGRFNRALLGVSAGEFEPGSRLFAVTASPVSNGDAGIPVAEVPQVVPILKGILDGEEGRRAVFAAEGLGAYRTAAEGDTVAGYLIEEIGSDRVVATGADNDAVTFTLRGAGERP